MSNASNKPACVETFNIRRDVFARMVAKGGIQIRREMRLTDDYAGDNAGKFGKESAFHDATIGPLRKWVTCPVTGARTLEAGADPSFDAAEFTGKNNHDYRIRIEVYADGSVRGWLYQHHFDCIEWRGVEMTKLAGKKIDARSGRSHS